MTYLRTSPYKRGSNNIFRMAKFVIIAIFLKACGSVDGSGSRGSIINYDGSPTGADGSPPEDDGSPPEDDGSPPEDDGSPPEDDGSPPEDDGSPPEDDGSPPEDDGSPPEDDGSPPEDDGSPPEDDGSPPEDDGSPPEDDGSPPEDDGFPPDIPVLVFRQKQLEIFEGAEPDVLVLTLRQKQLEIFEGVEDVGFDDRGEIILNDPPGSHQRRMTEIAKVFNVDTLVTAKQLDEVARGVGDDIIAAPNNNLFAIFLAIDRISDQQRKAGAIYDLECDLLGDLVLVSTGNSGVEDEYNILTRTWIQDLLAKEDINLFFIVGTTKEDGETKISPISSTVPASLSDYVIGASIEFPISEDVISQGTSPSATLVAVFFARLQTLLPAASIKELVEIGKWLLEPLENSLGVISFKKFEEILEYFSKDMADSLLLEEILEYVRDIGPNLVEGSSGENQEYLLPQEEILYEPPLLDDIPPVAIDI